MDRAGLVHATLAGRERRYQVDQAQLARAAAQVYDALTSVDGLAGWWTETRPATPVSGE